MLPVILILLFLVGSIAGAAVSFCAVRLPFEKSIFWPGMRCSHCLAAVGGADLIPLLSYWRVGGRCRSCGARLSPRTFVLEVVTGIAFAALFYGIAVEDVHGLAGLQPVRYGAPAVW